MADMARVGQVIYLTHHEHLCDDRPRGLPACDDPHALTAIGAGPRNHCRRRHEGAFETPSLDSDRHGNFERSDAWRSNPADRGRRQTVAGRIFHRHVRQDPIIDAPEPARVRSVSVTFEPGARTAWHTHPLGQTLIVTTGSGLAQVWGGPIREISAGDVVWFRRAKNTGTAPSATTAMTHIAIQEALDGKAVDWLEPVTDSQYRGNSAACAATAVRQSRAKIARCNASRCVLRATCRPQIGQRRAEGFRDDTISMSGRKSSASTISSSMSRSTRASARGRSIRSAGSAPTSTMSMASSSASSWRKSTAATTTVPKATARPTCPIAPPGSGRCLKDRLSALEELACADAERGKALSARGTGRTQAQDAGAKEGNRLTSIARLS